MLEFIQHENFNERVLPGRYEAGHVSVMSGSLSAGMELDVKWRAVDLPSPR